MAVKTIEIFGLEELHRDFLDPKKYMRAMVNALNVTATAYRKESLKRANQVFTIKSQRIKRDRNGPTTFILRARAPHRDNAVVGFHGRRPGLHHYATRKENPKSYKNPGRKGSTNYRFKHPKFKIKKRDRAEDLVRGFFQTMPRGGFGLWQRKGKKSRPFARRTGPSIIQMYMDDEIHKPMEKKLPKMIEDNFDKKLADQIKKK